LDRMKSILFVGPSGEVVATWEDPCGSPTIGDAVYLAERPWKVNGRAWSDSTSFVCNVSALRPYHGEPCTHAPQNAPGHKATGSKDGVGVRSCAWCGLDVWPAPGEEFAGQAQEGTK